MLGIPKAVLQGCFYEKMFWKYPEDLQENTHAEVRFPVNLLPISKTSFPNNTS